ncbi:MAG: 1-(5-phosphoribosyl)-5-[(5-phosphoribosylamino)methylideneamino]imidazole-4-carboxamide isomerase [Dehalococcoidia bacterium]|nr:1-(5-phosphoribosyl)-5-[(5-phosphoribosylamino)methylideneamino]imidazole-4-carboxamide isomerase [Dehalococcoidia bacterium]
MTFQVIPAIDLRDGRCVRLVQGDYSREMRYSDDPVSVARQWQELGAPLIHVVDLDGAKQGYPFNREVMAEICRAVTIPIEVSGGIRTLDAIEDALSYGAGRIQLGSAAVRDPGLVREACDRHPLAIVVSIDARNGEVMTDGWLRGSGVSALELARQMVDLGVRRLMYTDISRDGAMEGPNVNAMRQLAQAVPVPVVASGGVSDIEHLRQLAAAGCEGAIVGRALYEGALDLATAVSEFRTGNATPPDSIS